MSTLSIIVFTFVAFLVLDVVILLVLLVGGDDKKHEEGAAKPGSLRRFAAAVEDPTEDEPLVDPQPTLREMVLGQTVGDTLVEIGTELIHRRCADARRDGREPGQCCAARLGGQPA